MDPASNIGATLNAAKAMLDSVRFYDARALEEIERKLGPTIAHLATMGGAAEGVDLPLHKVRLQWDIVVASAAGARKAPPVTNARVQVMDDLRVLAQLIRTARRDLSSCRDRQVRMTPRPRPDLAARAAARARNG